MSDNSAAGAQPGPLPIIDRSVRADLAHYKPGRSQPIRWCVIHNTEGSNSLHWLTDNPNSEVSVHTLVSRDGVRHDLVDFLDTAWHVGTALPPISNANAVGVELENLSNSKGVVEDYTPAQLNTVAHWTAAVMFSYGIPWERVVRHGDIAVPPGRRHDPSNFDWPAFKAHVDAWTTFFSSLPENEHAHYIQLAPLPPPDLLFEGPSTIAPAVAERVLLARHSPIIAERPVQEYIDVCDQHGLNFAVALAFTIHENGAGTQGVTAPLNNWGAVRTSQDVTLSSGIVVTALGPFVKYDSWLNALKDWCARIKGPRYLGTHPEWTVRQALQVYAPSSDPFGANAPDKYADAVMEMVAAWQKESKL